MKGGKMMENIPVLSQTSQLLASGIVILALCMGIIFYFWSLHLFKKIELQITKMRQNIDSLENLSQSIYETAYLEMEKEYRGSKQEDKETNNPKKEQLILEEIRGQIQNLIQRQNEMSQKIDQKLGKEPEEQKEFSSNTRPAQFSQLEEQEKYQKIRELIIRHLKKLLQEKEQVITQELVYAMPNEYSLADIYRTLEIMKEKNQINWEDKSLSPQSILKME